MKTALIGCGAIAANHLPALADLDGIEIVALCDIRAERAEACRAKYAPTARIYTDYRRMLAEEELDTVHITTPHYLHCEMTVAALDAGKNVFLEKPIAISESEIEAMLAAERRSRGRICVCFQNRFNEVTLEAGELVQRHGGAVAARAMVTWNRDVPYYTESGWRGFYATEGGGAMINQAIHELDLLIGFCGKPETVIGTIANHHLKDTIEVEDTCELLIGFENGARGVFFASTAFHESVSNLLEIFCADKTRITMIGDWLYLDGDPVCGADRFRNENAITSGKRCWGNGHRKLITMFYRALREDKPMPVSLASAAEAVRVLLAAYRSGDKTVALPPDRER